MINKPIATEASLHYDPARKVLERRRERGARKLGGRLEGGRRGAYEKEELELDSYLKSKRALHKKHFLRDIPSKEK